MTETREEFAHRWHYYLFNQMSHQHARAFLAARPLRTRERDRQNINSIKGKDWV